MIRLDFHSDDRAVSIAVTHVLTIGITTILITGLLVGGSGLLNTEKDRATKTELRTIGNRMASEMSSAWYSAQDHEGGSLVVRVSHPEYVAGDNYRVKIEDSCNAPAITNMDCLVLSTPGGGDEVHVPLDPDIKLDYDASVSGGSLYIVVEENGAGVLELTLSNDETLSLAPPPEVAL